MNKGLVKLYSGDFNMMSQAWQDDGSVIITLTKRSDNKVHKLHVKHLYKENEEVLSYEVVDLSKKKEKKPWLEERLKQAKEEKEKEEKNG